MRLAHRLVLVVVAACGGGGGNGDDVASDGPADAPPCFRDPAPADRTRFVVVSHPYDTAGNKADTFEVLELSQTGELTRPGRTFTLSRAVSGTISFTPDGELGLVALENGKLGMFRIDAAGMVTVLETGFGGSFYASRVVVDTRGNRAIVVDGNTRENGGGLYAVNIACDNTLTDLGLIAPAKLPGGIAISGDRAMVAAGDMLDATVGGDDVHLLHWTDPFVRVAGTDAFGDDEAIVGGTALTFDGGRFLVGDTSQFSGIPNRVAVVAISGNIVKQLGTVPVEDPQAIIASPFGNVAVVASAFGDKLVILEESGAKWSVRGEVAYKDGIKPQLPGDVAALDRGMLKGRVLVSENVSVRQLAFKPDGSVEDLGSLAFGDGLQNISGAIGVAP